MYKSNDGAWVTEIDKYGAAADTGIAAGIHVHGSFRVRYAENVDKVVVELAPATSSAFAGLSMQLSAAQAYQLRQLLDAALEDTAYAYRREIEAGAA